MTLHTHTLATAAALATSALLAPMASAQLHLADFVIRDNAGVIEAGAIDETGAPVWGYRVKLSVLDSGYFSDNPGFDSPSGSFTPGTALGFEIRGQLLAYDPAVDALAPADTEYVRVRKFGLDTLSPMDDTTVQSTFAFGDANTNGVFHHHLQFFVESMDNPSGGVWVLPFGLYDPAGVLTTSDTVYIILAAPDASDTDIDATLTIVEDEFITPGPCSRADLAAPFGVLNFADVQSFLGAFGAQLPAADIAAPTGVWNFADIQSFLGVFGAGCD